MGAGAGYWARLLRDMGCEVHPFDCDVGDAARAAGVPAQPWTAVKRGGVEQLARHPAATLLMLYPDDLGGRRESDADRSDSDDGAELLGGGALSITALRQYKGDTVIHVGEWVRALTFRDTCFAVSGSPVCRLGRRADVFSPVDLTGLCSAADG